MKIMDSPRILIAKDLPSQILADLPLKGGQRVYVQLNQEQQIYAQILNSDLQVIQEIAENHIYFGLYRQQGESVIKVLREVPSQDLHPVLQDGQLTLLLTLKGAVSDGVRTLTYHFTDGSSLKAVDAEGVRTSRQSFMDYQWSITGKEENYLKELINKALQYLKEQTENLTQGVKIDVLRNIIIQIESLCLSTKKHKLKIQRKNLESILKNKEDIQKLIEFLKIIE